MSHDAIQPVDEKSPESQKMDKWVLNIEDRLGNTTTEITPIISPSEKIPSIYGNWKCFDDHFRNVPFLPETDMWQFVAFMKRAFDLNVRKFLEELQEEEDDLWSYYDGVDEQFRAENSNRFIEYLLANSCFLIFALAILTNRFKIIKMFLEFAENDMQRFTEYKRLEKFVRGEAIGILRYMLTMDHQIPLFVVDAVYTKYSSIKEKVKTPIHELVVSAFNFINPGVPKSKLHNNTITVPEDGFQHLLHIFHWSRTPKEKFHKKKPLFDMSNVYFPSATDMQSSATVFDKHAASGFDVTFDERILSGVMQLPPVSHFLYENEIYKNLLAFEQRYNIVCGFPVTSYIACIVSLVQTEADVTLLRSKGIIPRIEDKKDVLSSLECYRTVLSIDIPLSRDFFHLMIRVSLHHYKKPSRYYGAFKNKVSRYHAEFKSSYCSSPWIAISVVGGILLFVLTFIQTIYSALSYYKQ